MNTTPLQPEGEEASAAERFAAVWAPPSGVVGWFTTVNNSVLGIRYVATSLMFFAVGGLLALLLRAQLTVSENDLLGPDAFNEIFTMHGSTMMYLFAVPFVEGLALYIVPAMIGSRDMAFPRLTNFGYWLYLAGGLIMYASFLIGQAPDAGWFAYTPLSGSEYSGVGLDFWLLGLGLVEIAGLGAAAEIVVTILKLRAPGMAIHRMPILVWAYLVAGVMILFGFTPLLLATLMLELDRAAGFRFFDPDYGGSSLLWQHLFWFFGHPEVYIIFIPATGVVSMVVPTFARRPLVAYTLVVVALMIIGFVSFGLWVHHMFTTGLPRLSMVFFVAASFMVALGSGAQVFAWIATLWASRPRYETPLLYVLGFLFIFVIGGMTGVMVATVPFDWQVHDTYFVVAHFHYVLIGGAVFPFFAGLYYWLPKLSGRMPIEPWGRLGFWITFIGFNVTFFPMHVMGFYGMSRRVYTYPAELAIDGLNIIATGGAAIVGVGFAVALGNLVWSGWRGREAGPDPWHGGTLEWAAPSPTPPHGFRTPPVVRGLYPLWRNDAPDADAMKLETMAAALTNAPVGWRATLVTDTLNARPHALQPLPGPTWVPFITAVALTLAAIAVLAKAYVTAAITGLFVIGMLWHWMRQERSLPREEAEAISHRLGLPLHPTGTRAMGWWGVVMLLTMLATALGALIYSYFYLRLYSEQWPQDDLPRPDWTWPTAACAALVLMAGALGISAWRRRVGDPLGVKLGLLGVLALGLGYVVLASVAFGAAGFTPTANAYASAFFSLNGFGVLVLATSLAPALAALLDVALTGSLEPPKVRLNLEITELFGFFAVAAALLAHSVAYVSPYLL